MSGWNSVRNILCIRPDNMGDLIMSGPALRKLKQGLDARITVLTSSMAAGVAPFMPEIDDTIIFDLPWVKTANAEGPETLLKLIGGLKEYNFDAAVIFTVYSQNPLPSAMIAYQAGISRVLAYCRENPYGLISDWVPDEEPFQYITHQVERDLKLANYVCDANIDKRLKLTVNDADWPSIADQLKQTGLDPDKPWLTLHAGVSEIKRQFPERLWIETAVQLISQGYQVLLTGSVGEKELINRLQRKIGLGAYNVAGLFSIKQLIILVCHTPLLLSVNTGVTHIAAAVGTPVVVLYAQTNPQHTPWMVPSAVMEFPVPDGLKSKNGVIRQVDDIVYSDPAPMPQPAIIVDRVIGLIRPPVVSGRQFHDIQRENPELSANR
ncbi:glycosyltransferase family 9 protein [Mucilaginibacter sp. SMC90]|uniref:glycosyltransferase family 9 protein n=1 Tax=Mucilaginibacter sp. SMC90 TaxID=2929803 RepID=UPI001FB30013|nr:glycosyltransferase family 9 protein [Mucilaginibacter sp. SMC90]UOE52421.1 glycosyltransferase family 9 protein [Mucilaginibacter sp. SMC90]